MANTNREVTIIESPFSAPTPNGIVRNVYYAMLAVRDSLARGEAPYASHLFFTQILDDTIAHERDLGIHAGLEIGKFASTTAVYIDLGISRGMEYGISAARQSGRAVVERRLFDSALSADLIENLIIAETNRHNLPKPELIAAIYARIIK